MFIHEYPPSHIPSCSRKINLQGLDQRCQEPKDFYQPFIRDFSVVCRSIAGNQLDRIRHPPFVEPIDTVTVWKGLALSDCEELLFIQEYLKVCLEQLIEKQFAAFRARCLTEWRSNYKGFCARADCGESFVSHRFLFNRPQLVQAVVDALNISADFDEPAIDDSSKELLMLYLWSRDCLVDLPDYGSEKSAIDVRLTCFVDPVDCFSSLSTVEAAWIPDYIAFERLGVLPEEGGDIVIKPHYHTNAHQRPGGPHMQVTYSLESSHPWLHWDAGAGAFKGQMPRYSQSPNAQSGFGQVHRLGRHGSHACIHILRIEVKAFVIVAYPGSRVRLERAVRTRLTLRVVPPPPVLGPLTSPINISRTLVAYPSLVKSEVHVSPKTQGLEVEDYNKSGCLDLASDTGLAPLSFVDQFDQIAMVEKLLTSWPKPAEENLIPDNTNADTSPSTKYSKVTQSVGSGRDQRLKPRPNGHTVPSFDGKKKPPARTVFSNTPGIHRRALAVIETCPNSYVLETATSDDSTDDRDVKALADGENRHDKEAETLESKHSPSTPKKKIDACHRTDTTLSTRRRRSRQQTSLTRMLRRSATPPCDDSPTGPNSEEHVNSNANQRKKQARCALDLKSSIKRRMDRMSKTSILGEESTLIRNQDGNEHSFRPMQVAAEHQLPPNPKSPTKRRRTPRCMYLIPKGNFQPGIHMDDQGSNKQIYKLDPPTFDPRGVSTGSQTIRFYNSFAPLQAMSVNSATKSSSDDGTSEPMSAAAGSAASNAGGSSKRSLSAADPFSSKVFREYLDLARHLNGQSQDGGEHSDASSGRSASSSRTLRPRASSDSSGSDTSELHEDHAVGPRTVPFRSVPVDSVSMSLNDRGVSGSTSLQRVEGPDPLLDSKSGFPNPSSPSKASNLNSKAGPQTSSVTELLDRKNAPDSPERPPTSDATQRRIREKQLEDWIRDENKVDLKRMLDTVASLKPKRMLDQGSSLGHGRVLPTIDDDEAVDPLTAGLRTPPTDDDEQARYVSARDRLRGDVQSSIRNDIEFGIADSSVTPRPGTPMDGFLSTSDDGGIGPHTRREQKVLSKLLSTQETRKSLSEPGLSSEERKQMYAALKKSATEERAGGNNVVLEGEETDGAVFSDEVKDVDSAESEADKESEDPNEEI